MPSKNPILIKKWRDEWYKRNRTHQIERQKFRRQEMRVWLDEYKRKQVCFDCGMVFANCPECLDFHHENRNEKINTVNKIINSGLEKTKLEIKKCVTLCSNCHRKRHAIKRESPILSTSAYEA